MKSPSPHIFRRGGGRHGVTITELLVAVAITGILLAGVLESFAYIIRTTDAAEARLEAVTNARAAMDVMSREIKTARIDPRRPLQFFFGESANLSYGDGKDDDGDGLFDEETWDGADNDGDYSAADSDLHVEFINGLAERPDYLGRADLGDQGVDEDCRFARDSLEFRTYPDENDPSFRQKEIRYEIMNFDGETNVLVRTVTSAPDDPDGGTTVRDPIAFNVLSLSFLYWDPNRIPPSWITRWDTLNAPFFPDPQIELPVAVHMSVTVYAGTEPFSTYAAGQRVDTVTLESVVNIEQVLKDERYRNLK